MSSVDWFPYYLHPEKLQEDFGPQGNTIRWGSQKEQRTAGMQVLRGLLSTSNFREYVISAYPTLRDAHGQRPLDYSGPTPPSTPMSPSASGMGNADIKSIRRMGQCARFGISPETGLPKDALAFVLKSNGLPMLNGKQERLLGVAKDLAVLVGFDVEEIEMAVHATIRFIYYLYLLENTADDAGQNECQFQYRRWTVRSAYREEEIGLAMEVPRSTDIELNCSKLEVYVESLDQSNEHAKSLKYRVTYDLARVYLAQSEFARALEFFHQCQKIDPLKGKTDKFGLAARQGKPSVEEYIAACTTIVQSLAEDEQSTEAASGYSGPSGAPKAFHEHTHSLTSSDEYCEALGQCVLAALKEEAKRLGVSDDGCSWLLCIHPRLLQLCSKQPVGDADEVRRQMYEKAILYIDSLDEAGRLTADEREELESRATAIITFISTDPTLPLPGPVTAADPTMSVGGQDDSSKGLPKRATIAEDLQRGRESLSFEASKPLLAIAKISYSYLSGLRLLEKEQYKEAQAWFSRAAGEVEAFPESSQPGGPVMASHVEKDRALKAALTSQVTAHSMLAELFYQIEQGAEVDDLADDIDGILELQVPIRFEFLEHLVLICLRQSNKAVFTSLVGTIATNQKLYQQLPEIHITLLQVASMLVVIRDALLAAGIEVDRAVQETGDSYRIDLSAISPDQLDQLRKSVVEVAMFLLKIPIGSRASSGASLHADIGSVPQVGSTAENEIERFCRMWDDPVYLAILAALLSEILQAGEPVSEPLSLCSLISHIVRLPDSSDSQTDTELNGNGSSTRLRSIADELINSKSEQGRSNTKHLQDIALVVLRFASRAAPKNAAVWLYFASVVPKSKPEGRFMLLYIEFLSLYMEMFSPALVGECLEQQWFQRRLPEMIRSLVDLGQSGAAAVLHQCAADINYEAAIPLVVQAFEKKEIDQKIAGFFWDADMIEYGQYLGQQQPSAAHIEFAVPSEELTSSKALILSQFFSWLSEVLSLE